jgi:hypothetical protein
MNEQQRIHARNEMKATMALLAPKGSLFYPKGIRQRNRVILTDNLDKKEEPVRFFTGTEKPVQLGIFQKRSSSNELE